MEYAQQEKRRVNGAGGYQTPSATLAPPSPVEAALGDLASNLGDLHATVGELERRLDSILGPEPSSDKAEGAPTPTQVAPRIAANARSVSNAISRIRSVMSRLEI
jgi:hypothetical protein